MTEVQPGDVVFSFVRRKIIAIGVATSPFFFADRPKEFPASGSSWSKDGWKVNVDFEPAANSFEPRQHMVLIGPLLPEKYSPLQKNGNGNQSYLHEISVDLATLIINLLGDPIITNPKSSIAEIEHVTREQEIIRDVSLKETVKVNLIMARIGQGTFRKRVMFFEPDCRVTGVSSKELLIASHIKPWSVSTNDERLNGQNGLFLSPHVDKLFENGFISFDDSARILISPLLDQKVLEKWGLINLKARRKFDLEQKHFMRYHREEKFRAA